MTVAGRALVPDTTTEVEDPATGEVFAEAPACSPEQLDDAVTAADAAFPAWSLDEAARRSALRAMADVVDAAVEELAPLLTAEQGKPIRDARREFAQCSAWLRYYADLDLEDDVLRDDRRARVTVSHRPLGVVAGIMPWNYPVLELFWKLAPALRAGNTLVAKPSPFTPLTTLEIGRRVATCAPDGVVNIICGGGDIGSALTRHPAVRKVSFTGSVPTGRAVAEAAATHLARVTLELGGNDPAILMPDVDVDAVADALFAHAFRNTGQVCNGVKRIYVHDSLRSRLVDALADRASAAVVGDGRDEATQLGPLTTRPQRDRVAELVADARRRGARVCGSGDLPGGDGFFLRPVVVTDVDEDAPLVAEEQFGPAVPILGWTDLDDAVRRANASDYGLSGSVWSADTEAATRVAARLECGTTWINTHRVVDLEQPMGGVKQSGIGTEHGPWGLREFTDLTVTHLAR
jgi:acyl-CoA reductase-like NAD-dependent aldehyde dehydrogenase